MDFGDFDHIPFYRLEELWRDASNVAIRWGSASASASIPKW